MQRPVQLRAIAFAIGFVVAGCGGNVVPAASSPPASPSQPLVSPTGQATSTPSPAPTPEPTADSADQARWVSAGTIPPRRFASRIAVQLVRVGSGNVLMVGADNICTPGEAWAESAYTDVWRPRNSTWEPVGDLPRPRNFFALASLPGGSVLVAGGTTEEPPQSFISSFRFEPSTGEWARSGDLTVARSQPSFASLLDGRVLLAGGYFINVPASPRTTLHDSAELYDPTSGTWSATGSLRTPRAGASAVTLADGTVLVVGGYGHVGNQYDKGDPLSSAELFDPATETWSAVGSLPMPVESSPLVALPDGGALLVEGGAAWRFDRDSGAWTATSPMATEAQGRSIVTMADGRVLAAGGSVGDGAEVRYLPHAEIYDPATDDWTPSAQMPGPRRFAELLLLDDGSVLLAGGGTELLLGAPSCPLAADEAFRFIP